MAACPPTTESKLRAAALPGERAALLVGSIPVPQRLKLWEHSLREVLDAPTAVPGQGAASLSPSASFPQAMLYVGSASRVVEVPMAMCGLYRNNCQSCLLARDPYCGWAGGRCQAVHQNPYVALSSPLSQQVPSPFPLLAPFPFLVPFPFLRVVLGLFCHQRQVPSCPGSTSTHL